MNRRRPADVAVLRVRPRAEVVEPVLVAALLGRVGCDPMAFLTGPLQSARQDVPNTR